MSSSTEPAHRITGPADLLDAIPYLLGFHPTDSLVLLGLRGGMLGATARLDLADTGQPDLVDDTVAALRRSGATELVAAVLDDHCPAPGEGDGPGDDYPWAEVVVAVDEAAAGAGVRVAEALLVRRERYWSYLCALAGCCPPEGRLRNPGPSAFAAAATVEGVVAMPSRAALAATLEPLPDEQRARLEPLVAAAENAVVAAVLADGAGRHDRALVREVRSAARSCAAAGWSPPDDAAVARLVAGLAQTPVRDEVWLAVDARRLDGRPLWAELARRCPAPYDAAPMFLLAWANWRAGNGALAGMAAERALLSDPCCTAADLLLTALDHAVDPRTFPRLSRAAPGTGVRGRRPRARRAGAARSPR